MIKLHSFLFVFTCLILLSGCDNPASTQKGPPPNQASSAIVEMTSQNGLEHWKLSLSPRLELTTQYIGEKPARNLTLQTSTGVSIYDQAIDPLQMGPKISVRQDPHFYFGKVEITLSWYEEGKQLSGKAIFEIKSSQ